MIGSGEDNPFKANASRPNAFNPALAHAKQQSVAALPPENKCIRVTTANNLVYYMPLNGNSGMTEQGAMGFEKLYSKMDMHDPRIFSASDVEKNVREHTMVQFVGIGFITEIVDCPPWWNQVTTPQPKIARA